MMDKKYVIGAGVSIIAGSALALGGIVMMAGQNKNQSSKTDVQASGQTEIQKDVQKEVQTDVQNEVKASKTYELELVWQGNTYIVEVPVGYELSTMMPEDTDHAVITYGLVKKGTDDFVADISIGSIEQLKEFSSEMDNIKDAIMYSNLTQCSGEMAFKDIVVNGTDLVEFIDDTECWMPTGEEENDGEIIYYSVQGAGKHIDADTFIDINSYESEPGKLGTDMDVMQQIIVSARKK